MATGVRNAPRRLDPLTASLGVGIRGVVLVCQRLAANDLSASLFQMSMLRLMTGPRSPLRTLPRLSSSGPGTNGIGRKCSTNFLPPEPSFMKLMVVVKMTLPLWRACTVRVANDLPDRIRST
jgi:hypothetical protein